MSKKNDNVPVTCVGITGKGKRCTIKNNLVDNYCVHHHPEGKEVHAARLAVIKSADIVKPAEPVGGEEHFMDMLRDVLNPTKKNDNTKFDIVNGQIVEVVVDEVAPIDEPVVEQKWEIIDRADAISPEDAQILEQYADLLNHPRVPLRLVQDNPSLTATIVRQILMLDYSNACEMYKELDKKEWSVNRKIQSEKDWHRMHKVEMSESLKAEIDKLERDHLRIKIKVGVLAAYIDEIEENTIEVEPEGLLSKVKRLFNKPLVTLSRGLLILGSLLIMFSAIVHTGDLSPSSKRPTEAPVEQGNGTPLKGGDTVDANSNHVDNQVVADVHHDGQSGEVKASGTYQVKAGDTLSDIAKEVYGSASDWHKIYDANKDLLNHDDARNLQDNGHWIHPGQTLVIPNK